ncbi:hypothetical protein YTPLAS18_23190 [Nitrospira sp.]|nr:hypothetical protein YTPLAS18_23190 [Nitrospira sp.]
MPASFVLAIAQHFNVLRNVRRGPSLAAASLDGHFDHPAHTMDKVAAQEAQLRKKMKVGKMLMLGGILSFATGTITRSRYDNNVDVLFLAGFQGQAV